MRDAVRVPGHTGGMLLRGTTFMVQYCGAGRVLAHCPGSSQNPHRSRWGWSLAAAIHIVRGHRRRGARVVAHEMTPAGRGGVVARLFGDTASGCSSRCVLRVMMIVVVGPMAEGTVAYSAVHKSTQMMDHAYGTTCKRATRSPCRQTGALGHDGAGHRAARRREPQHGVTLSNAC